MAAPFEAEYAATFNKPEIFDDITNQIITIEKHVRDPLTGLLYHGWDELKKQKWADPDTGCSPHFWGQGDRMVCYGDCGCAGFSPDGASSQI